MVMALVKVANPYLGDATYLESLNTPEKNSTASFSDQCILLPLYVYNIHQDTKSARLIAVSRTYLNNSYITHNALFNSCCDHPPPGNPGNVTQHSTGVGNCVDCLVLGGRCEEQRYSACERFGACLSCKQARRAVSQYGVRNFAGDTQGIILNT